MAKVLVIFNDGVALKLDDIPQSQADNLARNWQVPGKVFELTGPDRAYEIPSEEILTVGVTS